MEGIPVSLGKGPNEPRYLMLGYNHGPSPRQAAAFAIFYV